MEGASAHIACEPHGISVTSPPPAQVPRGDGGAAAMVESVTHRCTLAAAVLILGALYSSGTQCG